MDDLLQRLTELGIESHTVSHPPVYTVAEARALRGELPGGHSKSLFLRNRKGNRMWLLVTLEDQEVDLKDLGAALGEGRLSLGSAERLMRHLGVIPGAVTPFAIINDDEAQVEVLLDTSMLEHSPLNYHPLVNDHTTAVTPEDLLRFLRACGHEPRLLDLGRPGGV